MGAASLYEGLKELGRHRATWAAIVGLITAGACGERVPVAPALNRPPLMQERADTSGARGDTLRLVAQATDPDGDRVSYGFLVIATLELISQPDAA